MNIDRIPVVVEVDLGRSPVAAEVDHSLVVADSPVADSPVADSPVVVA